MKNIQIGIIGGTRGMGKWFADFLRKQGYQVHASGSVTGMPVARIAACCQVVVISVPIGITAEIIAKVGPLMAKESLLMDLTSLKVEPVKAMLNCSAAEVIGCHPLFGPQVEMPENRHVVLCPARGEKWLPWLREVLASGGASIEEITPARHDELMSIVQGLNHLNTILMGMALGKTAAPLAQLDRYTTPSFDSKSQVVRNVFSENPRLYAEIICKNPDMQRVIAVYEQALAEIKACVVKDEADNLTAAMEKTAARLWPVENSRR